MSDEKEKTKNRVRQILQKIHPEDRKPVLRELQTKLNEELRAKEREVSTIQRRKKELQKELDQLERGLKKGYAGIEGKYAELDRVISEKDENGKSVIEMFEETGLANYLLKHEQLKLIIEGFFKERDVFVKGRLPEKNQAATIRALSGVVTEWLLTHDFDRDETLMKALKEVGFSDDALKDTKILATIVGFMVAREALLFEATGKLQQQYMSSTEIAAMGRETIEMFSASYESRLEGDVKRVQDQIWSTPGGLIKRMREALNTEGARYDYINVKNKVIDVIAEEFPGGMGVDGEQRAKTFTRLYELVLASHGPEQPEREALSYLIAEKIFKEQFEEIARKHDADPEKHDLDLTFGELSASELWGDEQLTITGMSVWERTYKVGLGDSDVVRAARAVAKSWGEEAVARDVVVNDHRIATLEAVVGFTAKWAVHAFQRITTTHTYAAALMCTDSSKDVLQDIEMQWHAFMVCLPNGLLKYEDEELGTENEYNRILVSSFDHGASLILLNQTGSKSSHRLVVQICDNIAKLLDVGDVDLVHTTGEDTIGEGTRAKVQRIMILAKRLVAGLLLALQNQNNFKSRSYPARDGKKPREKQEPAHRVVFVGSPLKIDCRPSVADYIRNGSAKRKGAPPAVQLLVRGHHKRQVMGVGRTLRKVVWIEPYWRGPDDAPILTRPKQVSG